MCAAALLMSAAPPALAQNNLPALGDTESDDFNLGVERKVGDQIMREIRSDPQYLDDPVLLEYLQSLWQPLLKVARQRGDITADVDQRFSWEPFLLRDRSVNAFALPAGYFGIHLGLMATTTTRDELASVLAHELTHVTQRHIARSIVNSQRQSLLSLAAMIVGVLVASRAGSVDGATAAIAGGQAAAIQGQLNFSRDMEREADRLGFALLTGAGFESGGMAAMFERLEQASRLNDTGGFPYLRSHPLTTERIGEARSRLGSALPAQPGVVLEHSLAQARARVLMDPRAESLRRWQMLGGARSADTPAAMSAAPSDERLSAAYSSALASILLRDWSRADEALASAKALMQNRARPEPRAARALALLAAQSFLERGDAARSADALRPHAADGTRPVLLLLAQTTLLASPASPLSPLSPTDPVNASPQPSEPAATDLTPAWRTALQRSADALQTWVATHPQDALAWAALSQAWGRLGQPLRALRADAESRLALGDLSGALDRLRAGQRQSRGATGVDFIEASVIDSRLRTVEAQRRDLLTDQRGAGN